MANEVYANGREIACKAGSGKTIAAFPDVCFTPPENPATPPGVPVPYPNNGLDSDTTEGTKNVKISGKEVMLKHISFFKTLTGDEAGCAAKKGVITSTNKGEIYFEAWSMDVKFEGENVDRHLDLTTSNHACDPGDAPPWVFIANQAFSPGGVCDGVDEELRLVPKKPGCPSKNGSHQTPHHLIPGRCTKGLGAVYDKAPCICTFGKNQHTGSHKACHRIFDPVERFHAEQIPPLPFDYATARAAAAESAGGAMNPPRELNEKEQKCVSAQLDAYYKHDPDGPKLNDSTELNASGASGKVNENYDSFASAMKTIGY